MAKQPTARAGPRSVRRGPISPDVSEMLSLIGVMEWRAVTAVGRPGGGAECRDASPAVASRATGSCPDGGTLHSREIGDSHHQKC